MARRYFTVEDKARVVRRLLERAFKPQEDAHKAEAAEIGRAIFDHVYSPEDQATMNALPQGWLPTAGTIAVDPGHYESNERFDLGEVRRHPATHTMTFKLTDLPAELQERVRLYKAAVAERKTLRTTTERSAQALLSGFRTVEHALEGWPEAADIIRDVVGEPRLRTLPAVTQLNELLDLPPEEEAA